MPPKRAFFKSRLPARCDAICKAVLRTKVAALYVLLCLQSGCANGLFSQSASSPSVMLTSLNKETAVNSELSPRESALACLKTAHQLDHQNHTREAIALYERARGFDQRLANVSRRLAVLYAQTKEAVKAKVEFERAIAETPKDALLRSDAGYFFLQSGDLENAEEQLLAAQQLSENNPKVTVHLAMLRAKQDRLDESIALFEKVVSPASARSNLGVILAKAGKHELAIQYLEEANRLDPSLPIPPAFLKQLRKN